MGIPSLSYVGAYYLRFSRDIHNRECVGYDVSRHKYPRAYTRNADQLRVALRESWRRLPQIQIQRLVRSCRNRVRAVVAAAGGPTRY